MPALRPAPRHLARAPRPARSVACRATPPPPFDRDAGHALLDRLKAAVAASASDRPHVVALDGGAPSALVAAAVASTLDAAGAAPAVAVVAAADDDAAERARYVGDWLGLETADAADVAPPGVPPLAAVAAAAAALDGVAWCGAVNAGESEAARARGVLAPLAGAPADAVAAAAVAAGVPPGLPAGCEEQDAARGPPAGLHQREGEARPLQAA